MTSPFPGMDPYLELHWGDVHAAMISYVRDLLNQSLPPDLVARIEERVAIESDDDEENHVVSDVRMLEAVHRHEEPTGEERSTAIVAPYRLVILDEPMTERFIRIIDAATGRLVTIAEAVSPANKRGDGLKAFREKRTELLEGGVHFVEIDLVRSGNWRALLRPHVCPREALTPYRATVRLATDPRAVYLYPISLQQRLPEITIPLRPGDPTVRLDLQSVIDSVYRGGRYATTLDYSTGCIPPLGEEEAAWTDALLKAAGKR